MPNTTDLLHLLRCPYCFETISILESEIASVPNDYLQCSRCFETFSVSKLDDSLKLSQDNINHETLDCCSSTILRNLNININYYTPDQQFVCKCPNCSYPTSIPKSEIGEVPNDYLQCYRCKYIFNVSKLDDFHKLAADIFSPEELEYCKGIIPDSQEIEKLVKSISEQTAVADTFILPKITDKQLSSDIGKSDLDPLFDVVSEWAKPKKQVSIDQIQRKFAVGYIRADRILEQLKVTGIVK